ncbi:hypothetical protein DJ564_26270 [Pseudomonas sp. 31-12]|nr:hypothetical protein DJ564_26270 [Pseudomonas sp. 31-12]
MWRGDLSPLGCEAAPALQIRTEFDGLTTAAQPNGDKSPRHRNPPPQRLAPTRGRWWSGDLCCG